MYYTHSTADAGLAFQVIGIYYSTTTGEMFGQKIFIHPDDIVRYGGNPTDV